MPVKPESDFATFHQMAEVIRGGGWWADAFGWIFQGPLYPALIAALPRVTADGLPEIFILNIALQTATVVMVFAGARHLFGEMPGLLAAGMCAVLPGLWSFTPLVAAENLAMVLVAASCLCLVLPPTLARLAVCGGAVAALAYARPSFLFYPILVYVLLLVRSASPRLRRRSQLIAFSAGLALVALPIANANVLAGGDAFPTAGAGWQPWLVYNERATGTWWPAQSEADYPFAGLPDDVIPGAQRKLAVQYVLANPVTAIESLGGRMRASWSSDATGLQWTIGRQESAGGGPAAALEIAGVSLYLGLLALALAFAVTRWRDGMRYLPLVAPIAYLVLLQVVAEGNSRYHVPILPVVAILAGGAFGRGSERLPELALFVAATLVVAIAIPIAPLMVIALIVLLTAGAVANRWSHWRGSLTSVLRTRRRQLIAASAALLFLIALATMTMRTVRAELRALEAVDPAGWAVVDGRGASASALIFYGGSPTAVRPVSYPPAVRLATAVQAGGVAAALVRALPELEPGRSYLLYLQVYDPGLASTDQLTVRINGRVMWARPNNGSSAGWQYLAVPWVADAPVANLSVEELRPDAAPTPGGDVLVRGLHLYPVY